MERFTKLCASSVLLAVVANGLAGPAHAQDFPATIAGVLCDTEAQVRSIVSANQQSADAMRALFQKLNAQPNPRNEPSCSIEEIPHTLLSVPQSIDVGPWPENGHVFEAFILHIQTDNLDVWFMYLAPGNDAGAGSKGI